MIGGSIDPAGRAEREVRGLFADDDALDRAVAWAREILAVRGLDPSAQQLRSLRELRRADRRLSLVAARFLVEAAAGRGETPPRRASPVLR